MLICSQAIAQPAQNRRIRGTIESLDNNVLMVKARDGTDVKIKLADNWAVTAYTKAQVSDIKVGTFIGVQPMPGELCDRRPARSPRGCKSARDPSMELGASMWPELAVQIPLHQRVHEPDAPRPIGHFDQDSVGDRGIECLRGVIDLGHGPNELKVELHPDHGRRAQTLLHAI